MTVHAVQLQFDKFEFVKTDNKLESIGKEYVTVSKTIIELTAWVFFTILYAYYGGALTMFFTTKQSLPFETIEDAMMAAPTWKVLILKYFETALKQEKKIDHYWKYVEANPDSYLVNSIEEGITTLMNGQRVLFAQSQQVRTFVNENRYRLELVKE